MIHNFDNFAILLEQKSIKLNEKIAVPQSIKNGKTTDFKLENKTKNITILEAFAYFKNSEEQYIILTKNLFEVIEFIEILKGYSSKKLDPNKEYELAFFSAKIVTKNDIDKLRISFSFDDFLLDKIECNILAAKIQKTISRCEPWQELEV